jgi:DNA-directed RNA polymerase subunit RPC12/RpoP
MSVDEAMAGQQVVCGRCGRKLPLPSQPTREPQFRLYCKGCGQKVRAALDKAGGEMQCPKCKLVIVLPRIEEAPVEAAPRPQVIEAAEVDEEAVETVALDEAAPDAPTAKLPKGAKPPVRKTTAQLPEAVIVAEASGRGKWIVVLVVAIVAAVAMAAVVAWYVMVKLPAQAKAGAGAAKAAETKPGDSAPAPAAPPAPTAETKPGEKPASEAKAAETKAGGSVAAPAAPPAPTAETKPLEKSASEAKVAETKPSVPPPAPAPSVAPPIPSVSLPVERPASEAKAAETKAAEKPRSKVVGFFTTTALQGGVGTMGGGIEPKEEGKTFLVVVMSLPRSCFIPSEAEFLALRAERKKEDPSRMEVSCRENVQIYDPSRFMLILADGRGLRAGLIAASYDEKALFDLGFSPGRIIQSASSATPIDPSRQEAVAVGWALSPGECALSLKVQVDKEVPLPVPDHRLPVPPVKSRPY